MNFGGVVTKDSKTLLKAFISTFTSEDFIVDIIRVTLYPSEFGAFSSDKTNSVVEYIKSFLKELSNMVYKLQLSNTKVIQSQIHVANTLLTIREASANFLTYDNVFQHLVSKDLATTKLVQKAIDNRITDSDEFRKQTDNIINIIHSYYEIMSVSSTVTLLDNLQDSIFENHLSPFEALKNYKDLVIAAYNDLSKLQSVTKEEKLADYFIISDESSCEELAKTLVHYISKGFSVFRTGFDTLDTILDGIESSSVHLISAPSNHGKSIFLINLCYRMIKNNLADFEKNDAILFITLEDDIYKLSRRFASIFGNYRFDTLKKLFAKSYEMTRATQLAGIPPDNDFKLIYSLEKMFQNILKTSVAKVTAGNVNLIIKHCNENEFTPGDLGRFIDRLKVEGYNIKMIFLDYIDCMNPTVYRFSNIKEYDTLGQVVQELRALSRIHKVPTISPTQSRKDAERTTTKLGNETTGDSYKKVRYTDFMYMCRMRSDLNFLSEEVRSFVIPRRSVENSNVIDFVNPELMKIKDQIVDTLIPFEFVITKSKDSEKEKVKYLLFCKHNLRIYNNVDEYIKDAPIIKTNSERLERDVQMLTDLAISSVSTGMLEETFKVDSDSMFM